MVQKHRGKRWYFGPLDEWEAALEKYEREWPQIIAGRNPRPGGESTDDTHLTLAAGVNTWLAARVEDGEAGAIASSTLKAYYTVAGRIVDTLGRTAPISWLSPEDFRKLVPCPASIFGMEARVCR